MINELIIDDENIWLAAALYLKIIKTLWVILCGSLSLNTVSNEFHMLRLS